MPRPGPASGGARAAKAAKARAPLPAPLGIAAVLLESADPDRLAAFYRAELGVPLEPVEVEGFGRHFACELASVYLAIVEAPRRRRAAVPRGCVALFVEDVEALAERLKRARVKCVVPPRRTPLGLIGRFEDPEGNLFELYQP